MTERRVGPAFVRRLGGIEGLRGIAAGSVLITHVLNHSQPSGSTFDLGRLGSYLQSSTHHGVILFFALSGLLLYLPFAAAALRDDPRPSFRAYARNRALRILPAYWVILLCSALVLQSARIPGVGVGALTDPGLLLRNLLLIQNYDPASFGTGITASWSLAVELVFYASLPLLVLLGLRLARRLRTRAERRWALLTPALVLTTVGVAGVALGPRGAADDAAGGFGWADVWGVSFFTHAHVFAIGLALAVVWVEHQDGLLRLPRHWRPITGAAMICLGAIAIQLGVDDRIAETIQVALIAVCCGMLLALTVLTAHRLRPSSLVGVLERSPLVAAGLVSYGVYLWHMPVMFWLREHGLTLAGGWDAFAFNLLVVGAMTGVLSWLTYRFVEKVALRFKAASRTRDGAETTTDSATAPTADRLTAAAMPRP